MPSACRLAKLREKVGFRYKELRSQLKKNTNNATHALKVTSHNITSNHMNLFSKFHQTWDDSGVYGSRGFTYSWSWYYTLTVCNSLMLSQNQPTTKDRIPSFSHWVGFFFSELWWIMHSHSEDELAHMFMWSTAAAGDWSHAECYLAFVRRPACTDQRRTLHSQKLFSCFTNPTSILGETIFLQEPFFCPTFQSK